MQKTVEWVFDIVIPQYKETEKLKKCLESLSKIHIPNNLGSVWIVENGGNFNAESIIKLFDNSLPVKYLYQAEGNLSKARNLAAIHSDADVIIFFDNDMQFSSDCLVGYENIISEMKNFENVVFFGGPLEPDYECCPKSYLKSYLPKSAIGFELKEGTKIVTEPIFLGGNHAIYRDKLLMLGGYDNLCASGNNYGAVGEETRMMESLIKKGYQGAYSAKSLVYHNVPESNSSATWVLTRAYRHGFTKGLTEDIPSAHGRMLFNVPLFLYRQWFMTIFSLFTTYRKKKFGWLYKIIQNSGEIVGHMKRNH